MSKRLKDANLDAAVSAVLTQVKLEDSRLLTDVGISYKYFYAPPGVKYSVDYLALGRKVWASVHAAVRKRLCRGRKPKEALGAFLNGNNEREIAAWLLGFLLIDLGVTLGIAVPTAALLMKKGIVAFRAADPPEPGPSPRTLLARKKRAAKNSNRR